MSRDADAPLRWVFGTVAVAWAAMLLAEYGQGTFGWMLMSGVTGFWAWALPWDRSRMVRAFTPGPRRPRFRLVASRHELWVGLRVEPAQPCLCRTVYVAIVPGFQLRILLPCGVGEPEGDGEHDRFRDSCARYWRGRRREDQRT